MDYPASPATARGRPSLRAVGVAFRFTLRLEPSEGEKA